MNEAKGAAVGARETRARRRPHDLPPILRQGFRPLFLLGAVFVPIAVLVWIAELSGFTALPSMIDALAWHRHEMLFGFASAVVAGFILTAIPNWTGQLPVTGWPLAALASLWIAGRTAMVVGPMIGSMALTLVDGAFLVALALLVTREIVRGQNWRNLVPASLITLLAVGNMVFHLEHQFGFALDGVGIRIGIAALAMLIGMIGGRIVPSFTRNWLVKRQVANLPAPFGALDRIALTILAVALLCWIALSESQLVGVLLAIAGVAHILRLSRWRGEYCFAEPLVLILHIGYGWLGFGVLLLGLANLASPFSELAALHALTTGAFGTMMLAVMTRATLGHTGMALSADGWTVAIYGAATAGAIARVLSPLLPGEIWLQAAGLLWAGAFLLFALVYGPMLLGICSRR